MGEKNAHSTGLIPRRTFLCLFIMTSILFILSWFFLLRSADRPRFVDLNLMPSTNLLATSDRLLAEDSARGSVKCSSESKQILKVFMYELPPEFHFGMNEWKPQGKSVWPDIRNYVPTYPGGLNLQHSIEYWLTLDLLSSEFTDDLSGRSAIRVRDSREADVIFVPFFSSLCYNRFSKVKPGEKRDTNYLLQEKLVQFVTSQEEWKSSGGRDHIILAHHPNSLMYARNQLFPGIYILSDFGRYPPTVANVEKDVIAPYKHLLPNFVNDDTTFDSRPTLLYFQGAIYRKDGGTVRQELFYMLKDEKDVHFQFGSIQKNGIQQATQGMRSSKFCLNIAGDTPSSNRLFDAIASHCVPVIISDNIELPYEDMLDYSEFCIFVRTSDALKENFLLDFIRSITKEEWTRLWRRLKQVEHFFDYQYPSKENDAVQMIWQAIGRKVPSVRLKVHQERRYVRSGPVKEEGFGLLSLPRNFW